MTRIQAVVLDVTLAGGSPADVATTDDAPAVATLRARGLGIASTTGSTTPFEIWEALRRLDVADPRACLKVATTVDGVAEGIAAGTWVVGIGTDQRGALYAAGADDVVDSLDDLPAVVDAVDARLAQATPRLLLTPGPLTTRRSVKHATLTDHCTWDDEYRAITRRVLDATTAVAADDTYATVLLQGSGTYAVEAMITCLTRPDEKILFLVNGAYGERMATIAGIAGRRFDVLRFDETTAVQPAALAQRLAEDPEIAVVAVVHCETTTGVLNPLAELAAIATQHGKRVLVDAMSSFAAYDIDLVALGVDALAASSNKCLEGLPGLSFVVARRSALDAAQGASTSHALDLHGQYQGLYAGGGAFRFTSPTTVLLALDQALMDFRTEGGTAARGRRYAENHRILVDGLAELGIRAVVPAADQSHIITAFELGDLDFSVLYAHLKERGFVIYPGKLSARPTFRIGNIGNVHPADMHGVVAALRDLVA